MVITAIISIIAGLVVGILSGLLGIGGGTILVPIFSVAFGLAPVAATGTSLFTIFFTSISGAIARIRAKLCAVKVGVALGIGGALTSPIGVYLATISPELLVVLAVCVVIFYSIGSTIRKLDRKTPGQGGREGQSQAREEGQDQAGQNQAGQNQADRCQAVQADRNPVGQAGRNQTEQDQVVHAWQNPATVSKTPTNGAKTYATQEDFSLKIALQSAAIGLLTGLLSGYVGLGGGFIMIPLMRNILGFSMKRASGTSLMAILFIALSGSITQISFGNVDFLIGFAVVVGSIPGAIIGGTLAGRFSDRGLSILFIVFLLIATALFVVKQFGLLG